LVKEEPGPFVPLLKTAERVTLLPEELTGAVYFVLLAPDEEDAAPPPFVERI
jgi:hypothetical protein